MNQLLFLARKEGEERGEGGGEKDSYNNKPQKSILPERCEKMTTFQL